jgi:hypothetical protein
MISGPSYSEVSMFKPTLDESSVLLAPEPPVIGKLKLRLTKETMRFFSDNSKADGVTAAHTSDPCCNTYSGECCGGCTGTTTCGC